MPWYPIIQVQSQCPGWRGGGGREKTRPSGSPRRPRASSPGLCWGAPAVPGPLSPLQNLRIRAWTSPNWGIRWGPGPWSTARGPQRWLFLLCSSKYGISNVLTFKICVEYICFVYILPGCGDSRELVCLLGPGPASPAPQPGPRPRATPRPHQPITVLREDLQTAT